MSRALLDKLYEENFTKNLRKRLQRARGQLIFINDLTGFKKALQESLGNSRIRISKKQSDAMLNAARSQGLSLQNSFKSRDPERFAMLVDKTARANLLSHGEVLGRDAFLVSNFVTSTKSIRNAMLQALMASRKDVTPEKLAEISALVHRGHGERGEAVSQVAVIQGVQGLINAGLSPEDISHHLQNGITSKALDITADERAIIESLSLNREQVVTARGVRSDYISRITFQYSKDNTGLDAKVEKKVLEIFRDKLVPYIESREPGIHGSSSLNEKVAAQLFEPFERLKSKSVKKKFNKKFDPKKVKRKTISKVTKKVGKGSEKVKSVSGKVSAKRPKKPKAGETLLNLRRLIPTMNARLHDTIQGNMGSPALNYRTGRFANSAKITSITRTPKGFPSVGYTYMRDPYSVFEYPSGDPRLATPDRDPRKIIEQSIRETAVGLIQERFFLRRE